jgi:hypothetical protein
MTEKRVRLLLVAVNSKTIDLKGMCHEVEIKYCGKNGILLGLTYRNLYWFFTLKMSL